MRMTIWRLVQGVCNCDLSFFLCRNGGLFFYFKKDLSDLSFFFLSFELAATHTWLVGGEEMTEKGGEID